MSKLREIQTLKSDFSAFACDLNQQIQENINFTISELNSMIARALEADSYESMGFKEEIESSSFVTPDSGKERLYVLSLGDESASEILFCYFENGNLKFCPFDFGITHGLITFYSSYEQCSQIVGQINLFDNKQFINILPVDLTNIPELKSFMEDLKLSAPELKSKYDALVSDNFSWSQHPISGFQFDDWQSEVSEGNTQLGYWQWVQSALFQYLEDHTE